LYVEEDNADLTGTVNTYLSTISSYTSNDGSYAWSIPSSQNEANNYKILIREYGSNGMYDLSDGTFSIQESSTPSITVTSPNGEEEWEPGSSHSITWSSNDLPGSYVGIQLYKNGSYSSSISSSTNDDGSYTWSISSGQTESDYYQIRIYSTTNSSIYDLSNDYFTIDEAVGGTTYYLNEDFEGSVDGWTTSPIGWSITSSRSYSGSYSAMSGEVSNSGETSSLYKVVSTPTYGYVTVSYYLWVDCPNGGSVDFYLKVQGNNSSYWSELFHQGGYSDDWTQKTSTINLNAIATPLTLNWEIVGDYNNCKCYVDLVQVY
jgi:hypothetical protein